MKLPKASSRPQVWSLQLNAPWAETEPGLRMTLPAADPVCLGVTLMALWQYTSIYYKYTVIINIRMKSKYNIYYIYMYIYICIYIYYTLYAIVFHNIQEYTQVFNGTATLK